MSDSNSHFEYILNSVTRKQFFPVAKKQRDTVYLRAFLLS